MYLSYARRAETGYTYIGFDSVYKKGRVQCEDLKSFSFIELEN